MRRLTQLLLTALAGAALAAPAGAYDLPLSNASFESGNLSGWQTYEENEGGGAGWFVTPQYEAPITGAPLHPPAHGAWQAITDNEVGALMILYREIAIPATARATLTMNLWAENIYGYEDSGDFSLQPSAQNRKILVDIQDPSQPLLVQYMILQRPFSTPHGSTTNPISTVVTCDLTPHAGTTIRLRIAVMNSEATTISVGVDNFRIEISPFVSMQPLEPMNHGAAAWGDFDNDDDLDLVIGGATNDVNLNVLYRNDMGAALNYSGINLPLEQQNGYAWGDYDNDGDLDLVTLGHGVAPNTQLYRNEGGASFTAVADGFVDLYDGAAAWADFDRDGDLDLALCGYDGSTTPGIFYRNQGDGTFSVWDVFRGTRQGSLQWGDYNSDGQLDLLVCGLEDDGSPQRITLVYAPDGSGLYYPISFNFMPGIDDGMARWVDSNGDGYLDVALAGETDSGPVTRVYPYDLFFSGYLAYVSLGGLRGASLDCGDFDHNGYADLVVAGADAGGTRFTRLYSNNGLAFTELSAGFPGVRDGAVQCADFDKDGDLDLLVSGNSASGLLSRLYRNTTSVANLAPAAPFVVAANVFDTGVLFYGISGGDDHSPVTGNLRVGHSLLGSEVFAAHSNVASGYRRVVEHGNAGNSMARTFTFRGLGHGVLHWAMQTVDASYLGGPFSAEQKLVLGADVLAVQDVPADQGGRVRLTIAKSPLDDENRYSFPISGYNVWRRVDAGAVAASVAKEGAAVAGALATRRLGGEKAEAANAAGEFTDLPLVEWQGRTFTRAGGTNPAIDAAFPPGTWELVGSFFSTQQGQYLFNAPTAGDNGPGGPQGSVFVITAHTTTPSIWFASEADSGQSVDNLAPGAPQNLVAQYHTGNGNTLGWQPAPEPDFEGFRVYRGTSPSFVAGPGNLVATVPAPSFVDPAYDDATVFYKVSTTDHAGNESPAVAPAQTVAAGDPAAPLAFALHAPSPNPSGSSARLGFALPVAQHVRLRVYDTAGRLVRTLADGAFAPGEHAVLWRGDRDGGARVGPGVYFARIEAGSFRATRRLLRVI